MTVSILGKAYIYQGLSTDVKPTYVSLGVKPVVGSRFFEIDTKQWFIYDGEDWNLLGASIKSYREMMSLMKQTWFETVHITKTEFGGNFGVTFQTLNKIYIPITKSGSRTIALVSCVGFTGRTNTLVEITIDRGGISGAATFKWRKKTFLGDVWDEYTEYVLTDSDVAIIDGVHINFDDAGVYVIGDQWTIQACGSWHTPLDGYCSYLTSFVAFPLDSSAAKKLCDIRIISNDWLLAKLITNEVEQISWRIPICIEGDGIRQHKIEGAELVGGQIDSILMFLKGWDEKLAY